MKKTELKRVLKPLIKQCVREVLLEEGMLSGVVSEVVVGLSPLLAENKTAPYRNQNNNMAQQQKAELAEEKRRMIKEQKRKVLDATGFGSEIFEGLEPLASGGAPDETATPGALAGVDPADSGVDISGIVALGGHKWNKLV